MAVKKVSKPKAKKITRKLPQNFKGILQDIGENVVLFYLYTQIHNTKWKAFKNLEEAGCDIVLLNLATNKTRKIEVKTRQGLYSTSKYKRAKIFVVSKLEKKSMDFLVCYWLDFHAFFIVPKKELGRHLRIRITRNKNDDYGVNQKYHNNWEPLLKALK